MKHHTTKILYIQFKSFGDVIVSTTILRKLKVKYPNSQIDYFTSTPCADLLVGNPLIERVFTERFPPKSLEVYDLVLRPYHCLQTSGGWESSGKHFVALYAESCGVSLVGGSCLPEFYNTAEVTKEFALALRKGVLLQSKTNDSGKDWSIAHWEVLAKMIKDSGLTPIQIGGGSDFQIPYAEDMRGKTSFSQTAAMMKNAVTTVCLDSAVQHLAAALKVSHITLYGAKPSYAVRSGIYESLPNQFAMDPTDRGICKEACFLAACKRPTSKCIDTITPEMVMAKVDLIREDKGVE